MRRSSSMVDRFVNHDPGAVCPAFYKLVPSTNCVYDCEYCFLQGTYRACRPFVCAYVMDFERLERDLRKKVQHRGCTVVLNAGEMSDPLACDLLENVPRLVHMFSQLDNMRVLFLTKSGYEEVRPLLGMQHSCNTILAWSINCPEMIETHEHGTASLEDRLRAARAAQDDGYEIRFRIDPMLAFPGWQNAYKQTIDRVYSSGIRPARITLGTFRMLAPLKHIIAKRFPHSMLLAQPLEKNGKRLRYKQEMRIQLYRNAIAAIRGYDTEIPISLCKESPELHKVFRGQVDKTQCNCQS
jgi:spore photoproduct lyase